MTLGGAYAIAQNLPAELAAQLLEMANVAFSDGVAVISALMVGFIVLFALYTFRGLGGPR